MYRRTLGRPGGALLLILLLAACRPDQKMANQPRYDPLEQSGFFSDSMSARSSVPGTVARGSLRDDLFLHTGKLQGALVDGFPSAVTPELMQRGQERYDIYCSMCHGRSGAGDGMIVARGYRRPPTFHSQVLREQKTGYLFDVITNGFGAMPPYASMIAVEDRWAIVAYIRALQLSRNATISDVPDRERERLEGEGR